MPVTFTVADHPAEPVKVYLQPVKNAEDLLASTWGQKNRESRSKELLQSTFSDDEGESFAGVSAEDNGFVRAVIKAYSHHHHLVLRYAR